jgi:hypothetical protein
MMLLIGTRAARYYALCVSRRLQVMNDTLEILVMPAGREMDALVHREIFGLPFLDESTCGISYHPYSTETWAAMRIEKKMREDDFWWSVSYKETDVDGVWQAGYSVTFRCVRAGIRGRHTGTAEKLPLAICRAALILKRRCLEPRMNPDLIEALADYAHRAWSGWMTYLFSKSMLNDDSSVTIPPDLARRWSRQSCTHYENLPENEKESDRVEARRMIAIMEEHDES